MIFNERFIPHLLGCLKSKEYVLFEHFTLNNRQPEPSLNILLRKEDFEPISKKIQTFSDLIGVNISSKKDRTQLNLSFKDETTVELNFIHELTYQGMVYLEMERIFAKKHRTNSGFYMPNIEHLFEYAVLSHFLNKKGLGDRYRNYFEDFHFFVKDGLVEFFNEKYQTTFNSIYELTMFDKTAQIAMEEKLKELPSNQFLNKMNVKWHNFLGNVKQARIF